MSLERPLRILLVDDSADSCFVVLTFLKDHPYEIDVAKNGKFAIEMLSSQRYDLVLMDIQMPMMDGLEATRLLRKREALRGLCQTRIVALSARATDDDRQESLEAGCDAYVTKPLNRKHLIEIIEELTEHNSRSGISEPQTDAESTSVSVDGFQHLVPAFLENRRKDVDKIRVALEQNDFDTILVIGHMMNGDGRSFGFEAIAELGAELERAAKVRDRHEISECMSRLAGHVDRVAANF